MLVTNAASSKRCAAAMCFPTAPRPVPATIRNGSTRWCFRRANCGARRPTDAQGVDRGLRALFDRGMSEADLAAAVAALPSLPRDQGGPLFREPWEAQAFAMTLALYRKGLFSWPEW